MIIGKDAPLGPSCVKASNISSTSAVISWLPSNSNFQHTVSVNGVEVRAVKPGVYRHTITGNFSTVEQIRITQSKSYIRIFLRHDLSAENFAR